MKYYSYAVFSLIAFISAINVTAQTQVLPYTPGITSEGVVYYLPKTALSITIIAECTTKKPGELNSYAGRYLKLNDVTKQEEKKWEIKSISITPYGTPDTAKVYSIPLKKATIAPLVGLTKSGLLLSINCPAEETANPSDPNINKIVSNKLEAKDFLSQEILYAGNQRKMAELVAEEIYDIRESRTALSKGQADNMPKDGEQLKIMINQLNTQEEALLQLFKGTTETLTKSYTLTYLPQKSQKKEIIARFSRDLGLVESNNLAGEPIYLDVVDLKTIPTEQTDSKKKKIDEQAIRYNVASESNIKIYTRANKYAEMSCPLAQFGKTEILSNELFNKRTSTKVKLNQSTGTILSIEDETGGR